jgi:hypothetical protein
MLQVDGGVKIDNIREIAAAGADTFVAGSAIFGKPDYKASLTPCAQNSVKSDSHHSPLTFQTPNNMRLMASFPAMNRIYIQTFNRQRHV